MIESNTILKYQKKSVTALIKKADLVFHKWIRNRDQGNPCISCGSYNTSDASHYYSAGNYSSLRYNENNVNLSCRKCNTHLSGNLIEYRKRLIQKIGISEVEKLDMLADAYKRLVYHWDRFSLINIICKYT